MSHEHRRTNPHLIRTGGVFSILGGLVLLGTFFYQIVVLGSYKYSTELSLNHSLLLPWINKHEIAYGILWGTQILYAVFMLIVPYAASQLFKHSSGRSSSLATSAYTIAHSGFYLVISGAIVLFAIAPVAARAFSHGDQSALLLFKIFSALGLHLRLFGELLVSIWIFFIGVHLVRRDKIDLFGWYCFGFPFFAALIIWGKIFKIFNWDPFLSMILAITFIWLGIEMRVRRAETH